MKPLFRFLQLALFCGLLTSCLLDNSNSSTAVEVPDELWPTSYSDSAEVAANADHPFGRMRYKLLVSKVQDRDAIFKGLYQKVMSFSAERYSAMKPLVLENTPKPSFCIP